MVASEAAAILSPAAQKCCFKDKGYICFEEDAQESMVLRKLLDKKLWKVTDRIKDKAAFEENINRSIRHYTLGLLAGKAERHGDRKGGPPPTA